MENVYVENGSRGISMVNCPGAQLEGIYAKNVRGPFPAGQCVQLGYSDGSSLNNFTCLNELYIAWPEDSISMYRSSDMSVTNGVVEGSNAPTGICVMYEGSDPDAAGGLIENVEARYCQGCFSGFPIRDLVQRNNVCASPVCKSDDPPRGGKDFVNMWTAGDNTRDGIYADNILVEDSYYYDGCDESEGRVYWDSRDDIFVGGAPGVEEIFEWEPRQEFLNNFAWESCGFTEEYMPDTDCNDFPVQVVGSETPRITVAGDNEEIYEVMYGSCFPEEGQ